MRDTPLVAHRVAVLCLALGLLSSVVPASVVAQEAPPLVEDVFEVSGDTEAEDVTYRWRINDQDTQWRLELSRVGDDPRTDLSLIDAQGLEMVRSTGPERAALFDLALEPGEYEVRVRRSGGDATAFALTSSQETEAFVPEPNDVPERAVPIESGTEVLGRLAKIHRDLDYFSLTVPVGDDGLRDITLESTSEMDREICLWASGMRVQCRRAVGSVALPDLQLDPDDYLISVDGSMDESGSYRLAVSEVEPRAANAEAEPNDDIASASAFDATLGVIGSSQGDDPDYHVVTIEGEPQLWQVRASGPEFEELSLVRGAGAVVAQSRPRGDDSDAVLNDLILGPGEHLFYVRSYGGDYQIDMQPLGPRDPDAEREPNNDDIRAEAYSIGELRTGRLATHEDIDHFRFTLAAPEHLRLTLDQPDDADLDITLFSGGRETLRHRAVEPGASIDLDLMLLPGDYLIRLRPAQPSEGAYGLHTERLDPTALLVDQEPNADVGTARPAPASLVVTGDRAAGDLDHDWYELPQLTVPSTVTIHHSDARPSLWFYAGVDAAEKLAVERPEDGLFTVADVPADTPLYLRLQADGPYEVQLEAEGWMPTPDPTESPIEIALEFDHDTVAAYWPEGQRIAGSLGIANNGPDDLDLALDATTNHFAWTVTPDTESVTVSAGESVEIPLEVLVRPDAWAEAPVQITVVASAPDAGRRSTSVELQASRDATAVGSHLAWPVPDALLGGLNVASLALGGEAQGSVHPDREVFLFDDVTPGGGGFVKGGQPLPVELVVDLAGDDPVPVRGTILNPLAAYGRIRAVPLHFELLLSTDGESWAPVLDDELSPLSIDQAFVLDKAVPATHAMLRVHSVYEPKGQNIALGEWKVIAEPGEVPDHMPSNIAAPITGGHVARHAPYSGGYDAWTRMLDEETRRNYTSFDPAVEDELEIVVAFQEGRAAQITELRWQDPDGSDESSRVDGVGVEVGLDGPLGPWQSLGRWEFDRAPDGTVAPYDVSTPEWARFVRLSAPLPAEGRRIEYPAQIEVIERATDDEYRSILGEWGYTSNRGPYEWSVARVTEEIQLDIDAGDTLETATPLEFDRLRTDQTEILEDDDWYRVVVPDDHNTLTVDVDGVPTVGVRLALHDANGDPREMPFTSLPDGSVRYEAIAEPGDYFLGVEQPPFNIVFTFDTSGSMGPYLDFVLEGMREFASDVEPGREAVQIIPVGEGPLLETWSDQPVHLENAVNNFVVDGAARASNVEEGLLGAAQLLAQRDGLRAILAIADAETGSLDLANDVWRAFDEVQPIVYTVHVGADGSPEETRNLMRAWADSNGGVYSYPTTHAEMERSFERMSTRLRRPSTYLLTATTSSVNREPARLAVTAPEGQPVELAADTGLALILDTSGSMNKRLDGKRRIDIAKAAMKQLVKTGLADGAPVSLRVFGGEGKKAGCQTRQLVPLGPLDKPDTLKLINKLKIPKNTGTPIAAALRWVKRDLENVEGERIVVLITDGKATCQADPEEALAELREAGIEVSLNIVGFALDDEGVKEQMRSWAEANRGSFYDATDASSLTEAVKVAVAAPVAIYAVGEEAEPVASTTVGAPPVELPPGTYRVVVLSDRAHEFEDVLLGGGDTVSLKIPVEPSE